MAASTPLVEVSGRPPRVELAIEAKRLYDGGMTGIEVAKEMGLSRSYAYDLLTDPDGSKVKERKRKYDGVCVDCGGRTVGDGGTPPKRCQSCARAFAMAEARWTREAILAAVRAWQETHGEPPTATEWNSGSVWGLSPRRRNRVLNSPVEHPTTGTVRAKFGSWSAAIEAAGFIPNPDCFVPLPQEQHVHARALYEEGRSLVQVGELLGISASTVKWRVLRAGGQIRQRKVTPLPTSLSAERVIDREIERAENRAEVLREQLAQVEDTAARLRVAKDALTATNGNGSKA